MTEKPDIHYIRLIQRGEVEHFVHLVRRYNKMVYTVVYKVVGRREVAEDISQEVFIKIFQNLNKFREDSEFSTWMYRIAYNTAISEIRKMKTNRLATDDRFENIEDVDISDEIDEISVEAQLKYLDKILLTMPEDDALLITMFYLNEQSIKQISEITGYTESNVKVKLYRIRKYMNHEMKKLLGHE